MDYNAMQHAWTPCQIGRVHEKLSREAFRARKFLQPNWCELHEDRHVVIKDSIIWNCRKDLEGHLTATFEGKEMSTMERFYRWVAGIHMIEAKPMLGFGPSTFNQNYQRYADDAFRTYVSDNPEQSTTHNYFLMTFTEQGIIGGGLFLFIAIFMMIKGAKLYHQVDDPVHRGLLMSAVLSLFVIAAHSALNELIEVDKVGAMYWLNMVLIHKVEVWKNEKQANKSLT